MFFQGQHVRHFLRLVIPPQTNSSANISVFNRWVPVGACPKCSQIADISRSLADHDAAAGRSAWWRFYVTYARLVPFARCVPAAGVALRGARCASPSHAHHVAVAP